MAGSLPLARLEKTALYSFPGPKAVYEVECEICEGAYGYPNHACGVGGVQDGMPLVLPDPAGFHAAPVAVNSTIDGPMRCRRSEERFSSERPAFEAEGVPNAALDSGQVVRRENSERFPDHAFVDGEQFRNSDGAWMAQTHETPVTKRTVAGARPPVESGLTADRTHDQVWKRPMKLLGADNERRPPLRP